MKQLNDTLYSRFTITDHSVVLACRKCGSVEGDGMVNVVDVMMLQAFAGGDRKKYIRVMVNRNPDGDASQADWFSMPLDDFLAHDFKRRGYGQEAYYLVPKEVVLPHLVEDTITAQAEASAQAVGGEVIVVFGGNAKANTIERCIEQAGLPSPFLRDRTNRVYAIKLKA